MRAIKNLSTRALLMSGGTCILDSDPTSCIDAHLMAPRARGHTALKNRTDRNGSRLAMFIDAFFTELGETQKRSELVSGRDYVLHLLIDNQSGRMLNEVVISYAVTDELDNNILLFRSTFEGVSIALAPGRNEVTSRLSRLPLAPSSYSLTLFSSLRDQEVLDNVSRALDFTIGHSEFYANSSPGLPSHCKVLKETEWHCESL